MQKTRLVRKAQVERLIRHYKPLVGLSDWDHQLSIDQSSKGDDVAAVLARPRERTFYMVFAPRVFASKVGPFTTLEGTVLHELLHVCLWPLLAASAGEPSERANWVSEWLEEPFVDPMARTLARYLPRPH